MRTSALLPLLSLPLLAFSAPTARPTRTRVLGGTQADVLAHRQHVAPRALVDVCVALDAKALATLGPLGAAALGADVCLCASAFPLSLNGHANVGALAGLLGGLTKANAALSTLVRPSP